MKVAQVGVCLKNGNDTLVAAQYINNGVTKWVRDWHRRQVEFRQELLLRISLARNAGVKLKSLLPPRPSRGIAGDLMWPSAGILKLMTIGFLVSERGIWQSVLDTYSVAGKQSLRDALAVRKGRWACNYVSGIWIPAPIPLWLPAEWAVRFPPISAKRKRAKNTCQG